MKFGNVRIIEINQNNNSLKNIDLLILPGNGSFAYGSDFLIKNNLIDEIKNFQNKIIGICLGMQLLFQESEESPNFKGIGLINGNVRRIKSKNFKLPLLGWYSCVNNQNQKHNYFFNNSLCNPEDKSIITQKIDTNIEQLPSCIKYKNIWIAIPSRKKLKNGYNLISNILNE